MERENAELRRQMQEQKSQEQAEKLYASWMQQAEAAKAVFDVIKSKSGQATVSKGKVLLATVEGDIHDIGKNIVKLLSYLSYFLSADHVLNVIIHKSSYR